MALKPEDPSGGFRHSNVMDFINEKMASHEDGIEFYNTNAFLSWEEVEDKLKAILEDNEVSIEAKEACTWSSLALGLRYAYRQSQLQERRVQWLQDFAKLHKSAAQSMVSELKELNAQHEEERKDAALRLSQTQANLAEMRKERDLLRWKLLQAEVESPPEYVTEWQEMATVKRILPEGVGEKEEPAEAAAAAATTATATATTTATTTTTTTPGEASAAVQETEEARPEKKEEGWPTKELGRGVVQLLEAVKQRRSYSAGGQREGDGKSLETTTVYFSRTVKSGSPKSTSPLPVQLPPSFTYSYSPPSSPFQDTPTPSPPAPVPAPAPAAIAAPSLLSSGWGSSDISSWSEGVGQGINLQDLQRDRKDSDAYQQRKIPVFRRPGDWDCPWCKAVNFSRRKNCFCCGRGIWLQNS